MRICTYSCLGGAGRQEVLVVDKAGDGEGPTRLQLRLGRYKPPLKEAERVFPLQNQSGFFLQRDYFSKNEKCVLLPRAEACTLCFPSHLSLC